MSSHVEIRTMGLRYQKLRTVERGRIGSRPMRAGGRTMVSDIHLYELYVMHHEHILMFHVRPKWTSNCAYNITTVHVSVHPTHETYITVRFSAHGPDLLTLRGSFGIMDPWFVFPTRRFQGDEYLHIHDGLVLNCI